LDEGGCRFSTANPSLPKITRRPANAQRLDCGRFSAAFDRQDGPLT